jgi:chorismate mutase
MEMNILPPIEKKDHQPIFIAGPCSAETEEQVMKTAEGLVGMKVDLFRAGIWKPRTRPGSFEGIGKEGLKWLKRVKEEYGFKTTVEVANTNHVFEALKSGVDVLWLGARTTVNPFSVQEVADAMEGIDIPVMIKNPINPDLKLWIGGIERIYKAGITKIGVIHRGFSAYGDSIYRNIPRWQIPIELKRQFPDIQLICDASHICGTKELLFEVAQMSLDLNYDGIMLETHCNPEVALSDSAQQVTPFGYKEIIDRLVVKEVGFDDEKFLENIHDMRGQIDNLDKELINMLATRMQIAEAIGQYKKKNNIAILQSPRWNEIMEKAIAYGHKKSLSELFIRKIFQGIHDESISHQEKIVSEPKVMN